MEIQNAILIGKSNNYLDQGRIVTEVYQVTTNDKKVIVIKQHKFVTDTYNLGGDVLILELDQIDGIIDMLMSGAEL
jgi:hypothetical protein